MTSWNHSVLRSIALAATLFASHARATSPVIALVGATVVDVSHRGTSTHDIPNAVVLLQGDLIIAVGPRADVSIPANASIVDVSGKFILPGLVDGFTGLRNQPEANAFLYEGVTTVVASGDDRRGTLFLAADPSPHIYALDSVGSTDDWSLLRNDPAWRDRLADGTHPHELTAAETTAQIIEIARRGTRALWIGHNITQANTASIIAQARRLHLATYGEFVATPYGVAIDDGVDCLLHMSRLELGLAPASLIAAAASDPEGAAAEKAYAVEDTIEPADPVVTRYGDSISAHHVALMPTFSLFYLELPSHRNLWRDKAASILEPNSFQLTSNPDTGELPSKSPGQRKKREDSASHLWSLDKTLIANRPILLAASGADWAGTLPGLSLHTELELMVRAGLSPRQALAAATENYSEQFGWTELGAIADGRRADLVVVDQNPTLDVANADKIDSVFLAGVKVDRSALLKRPISN